MTDAAQPYVLPARDEELEALLGADLSGKEDGGSVVIGAIVSAKVGAVEGDNLVLSAENSRLLVPIADARDLQGKLPAEGSSVEALIEELRHDGAFRASVDKPRQLQVIEKIKEIAQQPDSIEGQVILARRQGLAIDCDGVRGYASFEDAGVRRDEALALVGQRLTFNIRGIDEENAQLLLTREAFVKEERAQNFAAAVANLSVGQVVDATITRTANFGAFARIAGADNVEALLHVSEISLERVDANRLPISVGDVVRVKVMSIDSERQRIGISRREVLAEAQRLAIESLALNSVVTGKVSGLTDFGAFIELENGLRGLCHVSELSWTERDRKPADMLTVGQEVQARIIQLDAANGRVGLSIRQAADNPWSRFVEATPVGTILKGIIREVKDRGLVVGLADGLEGFVRLSDLSWTIRANAPSDVRDFQAGEEIDVALLQTDPQRQRILLGLKQTETDPWDLAGDKVVVGTIFTAEIARLGENAAFIELAPGLDARLHISEISTERIDSLRNAVRIGQSVEVMTKVADRERRRVDVSIKAIEEKRLAEQPRAYADEESFGGFADALRASGIVKD